MNKFLNTLVVMVLVGTLTAQDHSAIRDYNTLNFDYEQAEGSWLHRKIWHEPLINIQKDSNYHFVGNLLADFTVGNDTDAEDYLFTNRRGFQLYGKIDENFYFYTQLIEEQSRFANYVNNYIDENRVVPGIGVPRLPGNNISDFGNSTGFIAYKPSKRFWLEFGHSKHFIGDGYRSFLLSDVSAPYTYFKGTLDVWKFKYFYLFGQQQDINSKGPDGTYIRKYNATHYLSYQINKKLSVALFESIVYHDSTRTRGIDWNYLNPIILFRPMEFALGSSEGNVLIGFNAKYQFHPKVFAYGQVIFDEFKFKEIISGDGWWANKYAIQLGAKYEDTNGDWKWSVRSEINYARPYTFSHQTSYQNYGHQNQPLGHILGANFIESQTLFDVSYKRWFGHAQFMYALQGKDESNENWGNDIFQSYLTREQNYGNEVNQGNTSTLLFIQGKAGYMINPSYNLKAELSLTLRNEKFSDLSVNNVDTRAGIISFSIKTDLHKSYNDF